MECGRTVTVSHFTPDGFYKWVICGCPEGHAHKQVEVIPSYPKPTKEDSPLPSFFIPSFRGETFQARN